MSPRRLIGCVLFVCLAVPASTAAQGGYDTDPTREQFTAEADALCKESNKKAIPLAKAFLHAGEKGKAVKAGRLLVRVSRLFIRLLEDIAEVPRPPADANRIEKFVDTAVTSNRIFIRAGRAFVEQKAERGNRIYRKGARLTPRIVRLARPFKFKHC